MTVTSGKVDLKIVLLGKENSGKTSLVERYVYDRFIKKYQSTIGAAFGAKKIIPTNDTKSVIAGIWDTAGSERYESMSRIYYRNAFAAILCYDITDSNSFERLKYWINELRKNEESCKIYFCACKMDLVKADKSNRAIDYHDSRDFAENFNGKVFETSSLLNEGVGDVFQCIVDDYANSNSIKKTNDKNNDPNSHFHIEPIFRKRCCSRN